MSNNDERKIRLGGGFWLINDKYCCWICKEYVYQDGKHKGETYLKRVSGYNAKVEDALEDAIDRHTREINAKSINTLIHEIKSLKATVRRLSENIK